MALLASCWLIVESFIISHGFLKWLYLSFFIHPFFLVFCQIFLWFMMLKKMLLFLFSPFVAAFRFVLFFFRLLFFTSSTTVDVFYDALEPEDGETVGVSCNKTRVQSVVFSLHEENHEQNSFVEVKDSWLNEYLYSDHFNSSLSKYNVDHDHDHDPMSETLLQPDHDHEDDTTSFRFSFVDRAVDFESHESIIISTAQEFIQESDHDSEINSSDPSDSCSPNLLEDISPVSNFDSLSGANMLVDLDYLPSFCSSDSPTTPLKQHLSIIKEDNTDPFHQKYTSRMGFFNILYHERLHGMNAILNDHLSNEATTNLPVQFILWSKVARKRILRSLECDLEMIYVAQSCLFWEALHHQYHKVEALTYSENIVLFDKVVSGKFQELEILLERFVEDQKCECQRSSINTHERLSFQALLQVPDATDFSFMDEENKMMMREEGIRPIQLLENINNCIKAFWLYVTTDPEKKSLWTYKNIWRTHSPVEDPMDLELLYDVTKALHKKGILLKDVQGKSKCWLRRKVKPLEREDEKRNLLFAMIDMKLVQRLLHMSLVSKSHLKWCQEKLNNLDFKEGRVFRGCIGHLFPSS